MAGRSCESKDDEVVAGGGMYWMVCRRVENCEKSVERASVRKSAGVKGVKR